MFVFCCEYLHTVCLICYQGYCQMQMNNSKFQIFDNIGYSVCCPGNSCCLSNTFNHSVLQLLIVVTHQSEIHITSTLLMERNLYVVKLLLYDSCHGNCMQYKIFQHKAIECYQPMGNNIYCTNCFTEIDIGSSSSDVVAVTKSNAEEQGGLWWSRKTKATKKSSAKKKPLQRRRVTCPTATCGVSTMIHTAGDRVK